MKELRVVTANVDFAVRPETVDKDIAEIEPKADLVFFQEAKRVNVDRILGDHWSVHQDTSTDAKQGSGVAWRNNIGLKPVYRGKRLGVKAGHHDMLDRWIYWVVFDMTHNNEKFRFKAASAHLPPKDTWVLHPRMMQNMRDMVFQTKVPTLIGADWNKSAGDLRPFPKGGRYRIPRIDGFWIPDEFAVKDISIGPDTTSDHRPVRGLLVPNKFRN